MRTTTGDSAKSINTHAVSLTNVAIIAQADLAEADHPININQYSQKQPGSVVGVKLTADSTIVLAVAQGYDPTDPWIAGATTITPA